MTKSSRGRQRGVYCSLMPGECFNSEHEANEVRLTRQMNVARSGMIQVNYRVEQCRCGRHHVMTEQHWIEW